jgi:hypothetical protein
VLYLDVERQYAIRIRTDIGTQAIARYITDKNHMESTRWVGWELGFAQYWVDTIGAVQGCAEAQVASANGQTVNDLFKVKIN